jgi:DedD protein
MDSALKQRLIGAAVLVALAVIFLPMLLDGPQPESTREPVPLDIPVAPESGRERQVREIPLTLPVTAPPAQPAAGEPETLPTVDIVPAERVDALDPADRPASEPSARTAAPSVTAPVPAAPAPSATESPAPAPAASAPAASPGGGFAVNLGSFAQAANAESLRARLQGAGFPVLSERIQIEGKPATRLRAGPYATRAEAERARVLIGQTVSGASGSVVALAPEPSRDAPAEAAAGRAAGWAVQVGAFSKAEDANALRDRLRGGGQPAFVERVPTDKGELFRVRVGPELRREAADALKATLKQRFGLEGMVVAHP